MKKIIFTVIFFSLFLIICISSYSNISDYLISEGFNSPTFPPTGWSIVYSGTNYWTRNVVSARCLGVGSAKFDFYTAPAHTSQSLVTPQFSPTNNNSYLIFSFAYAAYDSTYIDTLRIFGSTNNGSTWTEIITLLGGPYGQLVTAPPTQSPFTPTCQQWGDISLNLNIVGINKIKFNAISGFGNNLYLDSIGVYSITGIKNVSVDLPKSFSLSQNYPNPFNPATKIKFAIPEQKGLGKFNVKLTISDVLGHEVAVIVNEKLSPGYYEVEWNASNYSSGIYFYKLSAGEFTHTKKLILLK